MAVVAEWLEATQKSNNQPLGLPMSFSTAHPPAAAEAVSPPNLRGAGWKRLPSAHATPDQAEPKGR